MKKAKHVHLLALIFLAAYGAFVFLHNRYTRHYQRMDMESHVKVIEEDIWDMNPEGAFGYLSLASARDHYANVTINGMRGEQLLYVEAAPLVGLERFFDQFGLLPQRKLTQKITHDGQVIGELIILQRDMQIYAYLYAGLICILTFLAIVLFLNTVREKRLVEKRVLEQTVELRTEIKEREKMEVALRESEERFQFAMRATQDGLWDWDLQTNSGYSSPGYYTMLGYEPDEFPWDGQTWNGLINPIDYPTLMAAVQDTIEGRTKLFEVEYRMRTKTGGWKWILGRGSVVSWDENGKAMRLVGTHLDLTARKRVEKERRVLERQLQNAEKMELVGVLAGGVAHDLNNVLGAIVGYPDLLLDKLEDGHPMRKAILSIKKSGERASFIVQDLLTLARRGVAVSEPENFNRLITEYLESRECSNLLELHKNIELETQLDPNLMNIMGSGVHLTKMIMNLCSNAAEAMPHGGKVVISTENVHLDRLREGYERIEAGDYVLLTVADDGMGISPVDLVRIFEPFYSKKVMGRSGTGLGMSVVWGTVRDHKGYIDIETQEGGGTSFKLFFPVTRKALADRSSRVPIEDLEGRGQKILVIDDVPEQLEIATSMLAKLKYEVTGVPSGEEAINYLSTNDADLIVLDMIMEPGMDGLETYRRVLEVSPKQNAIIASGFAETERVKEAQSLGAGEYIKKPYTLERLGMAVRKAFS